MLFSSIMGVIPPASLITMLNEGFWILKLLLLLRHAIYKNRHVWMDKFFVNSMLFLH